MKTRTKALLLAMCAVLLVVTTVMATLAFLTSQTEVVKNTFTVGNVVITLDEAPVDANGKKTTGDRVFENTYKLLPGHVYDKDPIVHVDADSEDCWLFVKITDEIAAIQDATTIAAQLTANGWTPVANETNVYAYREKVSGGANVPVFESFKVVGNTDIKHRIVPVRKYIYEKHYVFLSYGHIQKNQCQDPSASLGMTGCV